METTWTIDTIRTANRMRGHHWFDPSSMRFFKSRVGDTVYQGPGGVYFVSSEQFVASNGWTPGRLYTVRRFNPATGDVGTVEPFNKLARSAAVRAARKLAEGGSE